MVLPPSLPPFPYVDPAECNEVVFVLNVKYVFLVQSFTRVLVAFLFRDDDVCYSESVLGLKMGEKEGGRGWRGESEGWRGESETKRRGEGGG